MKKKKKESAFTFVFLVLSAESEYIGIFKNDEAILSYMERMSVDELQVFKVCEIYNISAPPEPDYEFTDVPLTDLIIQ